MSNVIPPGSDEDRRRSSEELLQTVVGSFDRDGLEVATRLLEGEDVAEALVEASKDHDLTVIGATREGLLQQLLIGDIPHTLGAEARGRVIMIKKGGGVASRLKRWLRWR